ncbi:hypothetical protein [Kitasatospora sp. NPDC086791]
MNDYLRFLIKPPADDKALRTAHLAAIAFLAALVASTSRRSR